MKYYLWLALLTISVAHAQQLPDVVVTAPPDTSVTPTLPLTSPADVDKTGTPIEQVPRSIEVIPRDLFEQQGATMLKDALHDISGASYGGQFAFGFFDRVIVRGLDANFLDDGIPDETSDLTGIPHSLTGVERIEVLKGPGSALYGSSEPGGTINLVHFRPSDTPSGSISEQVGSFGTTTTDFGATGPTTIPDLDYRIDAEFQNSAGFRNQRDQIGEFLPALRWHPDGHDINLRFEYHHLDFVPDAAGIPFSPPKGTGQPLNVPIDNRYYTPFAEGNQTIAKAVASDAWTINDLLTVNNTLSFTNRSVDLLRNAGGSVTVVGSQDELINRQLRNQGDNINDLIYQLEPTWHFQTGPLNHTLLTGFNIRRVDVSTSRETADLPNILNIFDPVVPEQSLSQLVFKCDAGHSCDNDRLWARYYGLYAVDQVDVTQNFKVRLSGRQDWFTTAGEARTLSPANPGNVYPCPSVPTGCPFVPGQPVSRTDTPFSWELGAVYFLAPHSSIFAGYSDSSYPIFNTEEPQTVAQAPERSTQYELGYRYEVPGKFAISTAIFQATRENVFTLNTVPNPSGPGNIDLAAFFNYRVRGWENDINVALLSNWHLLANLTIQSPVITRYPQTPADVGNMVPSVPSALGNFWTAYDVPLPDPDGALQAAFGVSYQGQEFADAGSTRVVPRAPTVASALQWQLNRYKVVVGVNNVFNQRVFLYGDGTGGGAYPGPGRTVYARLTVALY